MVKNYPMYAAGVSFQKADESNNRHFYSAQVAVDPSDDSMTAKLTKDGEVISKLPDGGGGGGSSDFSTAAVTIINKLPLSISFTLYGAIDDFSGDFELSPNTLPSCIGTKYAEQSENTTKVYSAALYEEHGILSINSSYHISIAGNIEKLITGKEYDIYNVTGDCTITIEATPEP